MAHPFVPASETRQAALFRVGNIARQLHDILANFKAPGDADWRSPIPSDGADLIIHNDLAPWNLVRSDDRLVFIDWDGAAPGTRMWDLSYAAHGFVPLSPDVSAEEAGAGLRALADGYDLDEPGRERLLALLARRTRSMYSLLEHGKEIGLAPWARLWDEGHGSTWRKDADWIDHHAVELRRALI